MHIWIHSDEGPGTRTPNTYKCTHTTHETSAEYMCLCEFMCECGQPKDFGVVCGTKNYAHSNNIYYIIHWCLIKISYQAGVFVAERKPIKCFRLLCSLSSSLSSPFYSLDRLEIDMIDKMFQHLHCYAVPCSISHSLPIDPFKHIKFRKSNVWFVWCAKVSFLTHFIRLLIIMISGWPGQSVECIEEWRREETEISKCSDRVTLVQVVLQFRLWTVMMVQRVASNYSFSYMCDML